jgi:outer membrane protein OmpA-like peptidoglycan-associated protein
MRKLIRPTLVLILSILVLTARAYAQQAPAKADKKMAPIALFITNGAGKPLPGEVVLFTGAAGTQYKVRSDAKGKGSLSLPPGDTYTIRMKTMNDTADYSRLEIPALGPNQFYQAPFTVNIQYDAARQYTLDNVHFDTGKPTLRPDSFRELNEIAAYMKEKTTERYEIGGHTDNVGKPADNQRLSQQRADAVKAYLVKKGVAASRLVAKGYGDSVPVGDNATEQGRQENRRTEVVIL